MEGGLTGVIIFLLMGIAALILGIIKIIQYRLLCKNGIETTGSITWQHRGPFAISLPSPCVIFQTENEQRVELISNVNARNFRKKEGEPVILVYNPKKPSHFYIKGMTPPFVIAIPLFLLSATAFAASFIWLYMYIKK